MPKSYLIDGHDQAAARFAWAAGLGQAAVPALGAPEVVQAIQQCVKEAGAPGAQVMIQLEFQRHVGDKVPPEGLIVKADDITEYWNLKQVGAIVGDDFYRSRAPG